MPTFFFSSFICAFTLVFLLHSRFLVFSSVYLGSVCPSKVTRTNKKLVYWTVLMASQTTFTWKDVNGKLACTTRLLHQAAWMSLFSCGHMNKPKKFKQTAPTILFNFILIFLPFRITPLRVFFLAPSHKWAQLIAGFFFCKDQTLKIGSEARGNTLKDPCEISKGLWSVPVWIFRQGHTAFYRFFFFSISSVEERDQMEM